MGMAVTELELTVAMAGDCTAVAALQRLWHGGSSLGGLRERVHGDVEVATDMLVVLAKHGAVGMVGAIAWVQPWHPRAQEKRKRVGERESSGSF